MNVILLILLRANALETAVKTKIDTAELQKCCVGQFNFFASGATFSKQQRFPGMISTNILSLLILCVFLSLKRLNLLL